MSYTRIQKEAAKKKVKEKAAKKVYSDKQRSEKLMKKYKGKHYSDDE